MTAPQKATKREPRKGKCVCRKRPRRWCAWHWFEMPESERQKWEQSKKRRRP